MILEDIKQDGIIEVKDMKINRGNLIDALTYYMEDNEFDYVHIRASVGIDGQMRVVMYEDVEFEDDDEDDY